MKGLEEVYFVGESQAVVKLVGIEISRSLDKISVNEGYSEANFASNGTESYAGCRQQWRHLNGSRNSVLRILGG